jgi:hypothetical protein
MEHQDTMEIKLDTVLVAITGTLSMPRSQAVALIESRTNARFSPDVTYHTNYLVAARFDTNKAHRAAALGIVIISEADMLGYVEKGPFPATRLPDRPKHTSHFPEIEWKELFHPEKIAFMEYQDGGGLVTSRYVMITCKGDSGGNEYYGGYDAECFKTFRTERILRLEEISAK